MSGAHPRWEYLRLEPVVPTRLGALTPRAWRAYSAQPVMDLPGDFLGVLNALGLEGWELVYVDPKSGHVFCKRPLL